MAVFFGEVTKYTIMLTDGSGVKGAQVFCEAGSSGFLYLNFIRSGHALPANYTSQDQKQFYLHFPYGERGGSSVRSSSSQKLVAAPLSASTHLLALGIHMIAKLRADHLRSTAENAIKAR